MSEQKRMREHQFVKQSRERNNYIFATGKLKRKTVIFEDKYNVNINDFSTTDEIDAVVEKKIGRKLEVVKINNHGI